MSGTNRVQRRAKNLSIWDAMVLRDVKTYEKEMDMKRAIHRNNQRQLKAFLDNQVNDVRNKHQVEKQKEVNEFKNIIQKCNDYDQKQAEKQANIHQKMHANAESLNQAIQAKLHKAGQEMENKQLEKLNLLNQIRDITRKSEKVHDTQECLKSAILHKTQEKELQKQAKLREEQQTMKEQINHFDKMEKRYRDIFVAINEKERLIQDSYRKLKPGCKNLALAETEKDRSIEEVISKQTRDNQNSIEKFEAHLKSRRDKSIEEFRNSNAKNLNIKKQRLLKNILSNKSAEDYIIMKDLMEKQLKLNEEKNKKAQIQRELKNTLDQQIRDKSVRQEKERILDYNGFGVTVHMGIE